MREDLKTVFKDDLKRIKKLKGSNKVVALKDFNEKLDVYMVAEDFAEYYPQLYTPEVLDRIVKSRNSIEAENILTSLRRAI